MYLLNLLFMDTNISRWRGLCIAVIRGAIFCCEGKLAPDRVPHNKLVLGVGPPHRANLKRKKSRVRFTWNRVNPARNRISDQTQDKGKRQVAVPMEPSRGRGPGALIPSFLRPWGRPRTPWGNYVSWLG